MRRALVPFPYDHTPNFLERILSWIFHSHRSRKRSRTRLNEILGQVRQSLNPYGTEFQTIDEKRAYESLVRMTAQHWIDSLYPDEPEIAQKLDLELRDRKRL